MFQKLFNCIFTLFGALVGYEAFQLVQFIIKEVEGENSPYAKLTGAEAMCMSILFVIIFCFIFYYIINIEYPLAKKEIKHKDHLIKNQVV